MSATVTEPPKLEDSVTLEVDGQTLTARKGAMLIDVTDAAGIYIPRFCYHRKLSVAANCRMCLVEVERAPKPQPACATPVMDGMKVFTKSPKAIAGQQATMEFLLINHPLDCPICDQGGECELQDLALGYGSAVSQYAERKRVVRDKHIGPLIQTDMTRCIHCTRCVRFGDEVAGLRELGATGRGEHMEIGTYIAGAVTSELSGNVIDLCPVGALTSRPYRYSARAWELRQFHAIAPHDCVGSSLHVHAKGQIIKRVVPADNEAVNETWISDRDRFSYEGLASAERLLAPRVKHQGAWRDCDWEEAFAVLGEALGAARGKLGALASPSSTVEEFHLLQKLVRGLGSSHIDHRTRQLDFSADPHEPVAPGLSGGLAALEQADAIVIIGGYPRHDQPLINHRIRKAALRGARVVVLDSLAQAYNFELSAQLVVAPEQVAATLGGLVRACASAAGRPADGLAGPPVAPEIEVAAKQLVGVRAAVILAGNRLQMAPDRAVLLGLAEQLRAVLEGRLGLLTEGANAAGAWLAGAVPHRGPGGQRLDAAGLHAGALFDGSLDTYLLLGLEPAFDTADPLRATTALRQARAVIALTAFATPALEATATLLLPIAAFAENEGTYVNLQGDWQSFAPAVKPPGLARPAWKVLRVAGERAGLPGFDAVEVEQVAAEVANAVRKLPVETIRYPYVAPDSAGAMDRGLARISQVPLYRVDALVRRAHALQQMPQAGDACIHLSPVTLARLGFASGARVRVRAGAAEASAEAMADDTVPDDCALLFAGTTLTAQLPAATRLELVKEGGVG